MQNQGDRTDKLIKNERRGVWLALLVVLALAATLVLGSDTRGALLHALAISIVFAVTWLGQQRARGILAERQASQHAVMHDELRQRAIFRACQTAFFTMLGALATFCVLSTVIAIDLPGQMLAALAIALGITTFLGAFLVHDRD